MAQLKLAENTLKTLIEDKKRFSFVDAAKNSGEILITRESFNEFPDLWLTDINLSVMDKLTDENPQISEFLWGEPELVEWTSATGEPLQGVLIKPANYEEGKRYPVITYFYRFFSQRLYEFNRMEVNHRPNFPYYTSNGYAIFLPDVKFRIGAPGDSALEAIMPGIQKLIDMGVADEDALGLHGHSWSGYQSAYMVTKTDKFAALVTGAPVANMTSAYSGIRIGSGLARQFQYEAGQSRIGESLTENLQAYIDNSPVFFLDKVNTPMLIQFGDVDDAVPWEQGIELFLGMRREGKNVIMLQYNDEPHHLKKYPNKVDYSVKMKEYFDHYLKGEDAPAWMTESDSYKPGLGKHKRIK